MLLTKGYQKFGSGLLSVSYEHSGIRIGFWSAVCEVNVARSVNVNLVDVFAYILYEIRMINAYLSVGHILDKLETVEEGSACSAPVSRSFVTSSVGLIPIEEIIKTLDRLGYNLFSQI